MNSVMWANQKQKVRFVLHFRVYSAAKKIDKYIYIYYIDIYIYITMLIAAGPSPLVLKCQPERLVQRLKSF